MAIESVDGAGRTGATGAPSRTERTAGASEPPRHPDGDSLQLSPESLERARLSRAAADGPEIREDEIARLREALADGSYHVDARQLARALLEFEGDLES